MKTKIVIRSNYNLYVNSRSRKFSQGNSDKIQSNSRNLFAKDFRIRNPHTIYYMWCTIRVDTYGVHFDTWD